jgi:hypothetical protein
VSIRLILCAALLLAASAAAQAAGNQASSGDELKVECTPASRASELIGQYGCVAGRVFRVTSSKSGNQSISLCPPRSPCSFHAAVSNRDRRNVGDVSYLRGKLVAFVGDVTDFRGHPRIVLKSREQIHVTAGNPPSEFDAARSRPSGKSGQSGKPGRSW